MSERLERPEGKFFKRKVPESAATEHSPFVHPSKISELAVETTLDAYLADRGVNIDRFIEILRHCKVPEANIAALEMMWGYRLVRIANSNRIFLDKIFLLLFELGISELLSKQDINLKDALFGEEDGPTVNTATRVVKRAVSALNMSDLGKGIGSSSVSPKETSPAARGSNQLDDPSLSQSLRGLQETLRAMEGTTGGKKKPVASADLPQSKCLDLNLTVRELLAEVVSEDRLREALESKSESESEPESESVKAPPFNVDLLLKSLQGVTLAAMKKDFEESYGFLKKALLKLNIKIEGEEY